MGFPVTTSRGANCAAAGTSGRFLLPEAVGRVVRGAI